MRDEIESISFRSGDLDLYGRIRHVAQEAPTIVLLSGLGFDYRGHGRSPRPRGRWTVDELTADCRHALDFVRQRYRGPDRAVRQQLGAMVAYGPAPATPAHARSRPPTAQHASPTSC